MKAATLEWDQLDEAGFCYLEGGAIELYIDAHEPLMGQIDADWCDSILLPPHLADLSDFVADVDGVLDCPEGANARPFDDELHLVVPVPATSEWGLIVMSLLALTAGTLVFGRRRPTPA